MRSTSGTEGRTSARSSIVTEVVPAATFWPAEDYHQDYIGKHPDVACHAKVSRFGPESPAPATTAPKPA